MKHESVTVALACPSGLLAVAHVAGELWLLQQQSSGNREEALASSGGAASLWVEVAPEHESRTTENMNL